MTQQEFVETKERIEKYKELEIQIKRLENEKYFISCGLLNIEASYEKKIDCTNRHDGFCDRLQKALVDFYDSEIETIQKIMEDI